MSVCMELKCPSAGQQLWCGQGNQLYKAKYVLETLELFLHEHRGQELFYDNDLHWSTRYVKMVDWSGVSNDWEIYANGVLLGVYPGYVTEAVRAACEQHFPGEELFLPWLQCGKHNIRFLPSEKRANP